MLVFLRLVSVTNAALWFGAVVFFTFGAAPGFFSEEMLTLMPRSHAGAAAMVLLKRYYLLQYVCASLAVAHLVAEWLYAGKPLRRATFYLVLGLTALVLCQGIWLQPKLAGLHLAMYGQRSTAEQRLHAQKTFGLWHGTAAVLNLLVAAGLLVHVWRATEPDTPLRLPGSPKFKS